MILMIAVFFTAGSTLLIPYVDINLLLGLIILLWVMMDIFLRIKIKQAAQSIPAKSKKAMEQAYRAGISKSTE